jgi:hypothetical protein
MSATTFDNSVDRPFPPIAWLSTAALGFVVVGGIIVASHAPGVSPLGLPLAFLCVGAVLLVSALGLLTQLEDFAWPTFMKVFKWELLAYVIVSGMIELAFVHDHMRGSSLVVVTLMLVVFAVSVPTTAAFTVARYAQPPPTT